VVFYTKIHTQCCIRQVEENRKSYGRFGVDLSCGFVVPQHVLPLVVHVHQGEGWRRANYRLGL
jgi:hypothetical protein